MRNWQWALAFVLSLIIHGAIAGLYWRAEAPEQFGAAGLGEGGIEVGLGMQGSYVEVEPPAHKEPSESAEPEPKNEVQEIEETLTERPEALAQEQPAVIDTPSDDVVEVSAESLPEIDAVATAELLPNAILSDAEIARPPSLERPKTEDIPDETLSTQKTSINADSRDETEPLNKASSNIAMNNATGIANNRPVGGKMGNAQTYLGHLMAWLNNYKQYPTEAKKHKQQGTVKLQFTIDRQGQILDYKIKESSGNPVLDAAAIDMLKAAAPLPAMPDDFYPNRGQMPLVIPIEYSLITNRSL
ncbi:MAG: energy transducer TonB [Porticoccus sp.]|nr:energy transducer TonB [Porticoccus sp.]